MDKKAYKRAHYQTNRDRYLKRNKERRERVNFDSRRQDILKRDDYTCQTCGIRYEDESQLMVHHEDRSGRGSDDHNNEFDNLTTLCRSCHCREHHEELLAIRRANSIGRWSLEHDQCTDCATTSVPYGGKGRCANCYAKYLRANRSGKWSRNYEKCVHCGTTDFPYSAKGLCSSCRAHLRRERLKQEKIESSPTHL